MTELEMLEWEFEYSATHNINLLEDCDPYVRELMREAVSDKLFRENMHGLTDAEENYIRRQDEGVPQTTNHEIWKKENREWWIEVLSDKYKKFHGFYFNYVRLFGFPWNPQGKFDANILGLKIEELKKSA